MLAESSETRNSRVVVRRKCQTHPEFGCVPPDDLSHNRVITRAILPSSILLSDNPVTVSTVPSDGPPARVRPDRA